MHCARSSSKSSDTNGVRGLNFGVTQSPDRFLRRSLSGSHALNAAHVDDDDHDEEEEEKDDTFSGEGSEQSTRKFFVGQWLDVKDTVDNWLEATIMDTAALGEKEGTRASSKSSHFSLFLCLSTNAGCK